MHVEPGVVVVDRTDDPLSLRCPAPFNVLRNRFMSAWHYLLYMKATRLQLYGTADRFLTLDDPAELEAMAGPLEQGDQEKWLQCIRFDLLTAHSNKFQANPQMLDVLLGTGTQLIVSTTHPGTMWSAPVLADGVQSGGKANWVGCNLEGISLMRARELLTASHDPVVARERYAEPLSLRARIRECWAWDPEVSMVSKKTYEAWLAQIRAASPHEVIDGLHALMRSRFWDVDIHDPARAGFLHWVRSEFGIELPPDPALLRLGQGI
ncbi:NADAR family protein [Massilia sp. YIM B02763]|uniref:NADAR family protein n=1 Tax=Massilia sp. YIM B02763 TaxID=3050130 RepID=UPI0025B70F85|nr:NADAR family protein [Massilia sp. YIM B02763]MDN4051742.1 NADAR family protein [Massilia sp. YIM B02763]